jgi:acyl-CoA reductase-like NAD-dependent aldehyde dehydrogenase
MSVGPFDTLASISAFLSRDLLSVVPKEMASEVRAAVKLLQDVADELDWLPAVLRAECEDLLALEARAQQLIKLDINDESRKLISAPTASISEQIDLHRNVCEAATRAVLKLQSRIRTTSTDKEDSLKLRELLDQYYETLGRHAETRLRWQSVFDGKQNRKSPTESHEE